MHNNKLLSFEQLEKDRILRTNKNVIVNNKSDLKKYVLEAINNKESNKYIYLGVLPDETLKRIKNEVTDIKQSKINSILEENKRYDLAISQEEIRHLKKESLEKNQ